MGSTDYNNVGLNIVLNFVHKCKFPNKFVSYPVACSACLGIQPYNSSCRAESQTTQLPFIHILT